MKKKKAAFLHHQHTDFKSFDIIWNNSYDIFTMAVLDFLLLH